MGVIGAFITFIYPIAVAKEDALNKNISRIHEEIHLNTSQISRQIEQSGAIIYRGHYNSIVLSGSAKLDQALENAKVIKNTFAMHEIKKEERGKFIKHEMLQKRKVLIKKTIESNKNYQWIDILSRSALPKVNETIAEIYELHNEKYIPMVLDDEFPVVNMIIIKSNDHAEVWFGFGLIKGVEDGPVYSTEDSRLVEYFEAYFDSLYEKARKWVPSTIMLAQGAWVSVAYEDGKMVDIAITKISPSNPDGRSGYFVNGRIFKCLPNDTENGFSLKYDREFKTASANYMPHESPPVMYFNHTDEMEGGSIPERGKKWGGGYYKFIYAPENMLEYRGEVYTLSGVHREIYGRKLSSSVYNDIKNDPKNRAGTYSNLASLLANDRVAISATDCLGEKSQFGKSELFATSSH